MLPMNYRPFQNHVRKACALATALILPTLTHAQQVITSVKPVPVPHLPEANPFWVLIPFIGVALFLSARQLFREKAAEKNSR